jgi:hypothetical protein
LGAGEAGAEIAEAVVVVGGVTSTAVEEAVGVDANGIVANGEGAGSGAVDMGGEGKETRGSGRSAALTY